MEIIPGTHVSAASPASAAASPTASRGEGEPAPKVNCQPSSSTAAPRRSRKWLLSVPGEVKIARVPAAASRK